MRVEIPLKLPSLNDYIKHCRANKYVAAQFKTKIENEIGMFLIDMPKYEKPIKIEFTWVEGNKKRDLDNVCYAKKHILDAMVKYGKLKDDNRNYVTNFIDKFEYGKEFKVIMDITVVQ